MLILNKLILQLISYSWIINTAVLKGIYFWILQLPNPSLSCLAKYLGFIWQSLAYKIITSVISDFLSLNEKLNWAVLNKIGLLAYGNCESSDKSALWSKPFLQYRFLMFHTLLIRHWSHRADVKADFNTCCLQMHENPFVMVLLSLCYINQTWQNRAISCPCSISVISAQLSSTLQCKMNGEFSSTFLNIFSLCNYES